MPIERPIADLAAHADVFPGPHLEMVTASILAGNTAGQLWEIAQGAAGPLLLLWDGGNNVFYLGGRPADGAARAELRALLVGELRARSLAAGRPYFKARALDPALDEGVAELFEGIEHRERTFRFYGPGPLPPLPEPDLPGLRFAPIDRALLADDTLGGIGEVREEIGAMWPSQERFVAQGFGWAALLDQRIVCWCTSEYVGPVACGCGIATAEEFQRRGIAAATAARFREEAARRGLTHFWECNAANTPSWRVAERLGFLLLAEERYVVGSFGT
ncbi:MAG TPA: GNAT family N-acetyltransferase [Roseiflexaceae bacterium]|nr:GNAT family N-acetyltransferase [Roseiflexaceae bacterium]